MPQPRKRPDLAERNRRTAKLGGMWRSPTHITWQNMIDRCTNPKQKDFIKYGARGIRVCDRWRDFNAFLADMGRRPEGMTLDRIDGSGHYEPGNCRWATVIEQNRNRRSNVYITHDGKTMTIAEWAEQAGIERKTLEYRIRAGWPTERALTIKSLIPRKRN